MKCSEQVYAKIIGRNKGLQNVVKIIAVLSNIIVGFDAASRVVNEVEQPCELSSTNLLEVNVLRLAFFVDATRTICVLLQRTFKVTEMVLQKSLG